jgi:methionyl aminopeptidase
LQAQPAAYAVHMPELKSPEQIELMRAAGRIVARALDEARRAAVAGTTLLELDGIARGVIEDAGAVPTFLDYKPRFAPTPYPATICASVNDVIVHGIPDGYRLREGDLLGIDCACHFEGFCADSAVSVVVGGRDPAGQRLIDITAEALEAGIAAAVVGGRLSDVSAAVGRVGRAAGFGIPRDFGGHGIGRAMHEAPSVPNDGRAGQGMLLEAGLVIAIEPMFMAGGSDGYRVAPDGWALCTDDGSRAAHVEHTVAITDAGPDVLTRLVPPPSA